MLLSMTYCPVVFNRTDHDPHDCFSCISHLHAKLSNLLNDMQILSQASFPRFSSIWYVGQKRDVKWRVVIKRPYLEGFFEQIAGKSRRLQTHALFVSWFTCLNDKMRLKRWNVWVFWTRATIERKSDANRRKVTTFTKFSTIVGNNFLWPCKTAAFISHSAKTKYEVLNIISPASRSSHFHPIILYAIWHESRSQATSKPVLIISVPKAGKLEQICFGI